MKIEREVADEKKIGKVCENFLSPPFELSIFGSLKLKIDLYPWKTRISSTGLNCRIKG
jgi:hypothetical protein